MSFKKTVVFLFLSFFLCWTEIAFGQVTLNANPSSDQVLNCVEVQTRINQMLDLHYSFKKFNDEISQRTFNKLFENLDQSKIFFTTHDIHNFKNLKLEIPKRIENNDCNFIFEIYDKFITQVKTQTSNAKKIISKPIIYTEKDYIEIAKPQWASNEKETEERLEKKIKLQYLELEELGLDKEEIKKRIEITYNKIEKKYEKMSIDKIYSIFLNSFAESLDPHSSHMLPSEHNNFNIHVSNKLEGIGAQLHEKDGYIIIHSIVPGGVAQRDGRLKVGDKLVAIDSGNGEGTQDVLYLDVEQAVELIRGSQGTKVKLTVLRKTSTGNKKINIVLTRDEVSLKDENVRSIIYNNHGEKIGIIRIPNFYTDLKCKNKLFARCHGVAYDTENELKKLMQEGVEGVLIDLRNNGGGDFSESIKLTSLFIPHGIVVQTDDKNKDITKQETLDSSWVYTGPLIVLINRNSASASEIFTGSIQDYERGIIVGDDHTYGKATIQIVQEISGNSGRKSDGALKITQSKFYRPSGLSNQKSGVRSDILLPSQLLAFDIGEGQLEYALPHDHIPPADGFKPLQNLKPFINKLKELSQSRVSKDLNYQKLIKKITKIKYEKNKRIPLTHDYISLINELKNNKEEQLNEDYNQLLIKEDDVQLKEAIAITNDSIKLTRSPLQWVGIR